LNRSEQFCFSAVGVGEEERLGELEDRVTCGSGAVEGGCVEVVEGYRTAMLEH
jgi:hypothetical protein